jgi:hypothetical protein
MVDSKSSRPSTLAALGQKDSCCCEFWFNPEAEQQLLRPPAMTTEFEVSEGPVTKCDNPRIVVLEASARIEE